MSQPMDGAPSPTDQGAEGPFDPLFDLRGRVILVAGAAGGLGRALAEELHRRGARLGLMDLPGPALDDLTAALPGARAVPADITDAGALAAAFDTLVAALGPPDGAMNAAGVLKTGPGLEMSPGTLRQTFEVNVTGAFAFSQAVARRMIDAKRQGAILHLSSVSSMVANPGYAAYSPSKAALSQMVRVLGREWAAEGLRVNAIGPSLARTQMTRGALAAPEQRKAALALIPMGRFCEPEDLVGPTVMLLSDAGRYISGQTLHVDGGRTLV